jgi:hypothetical protein
MNESAEALKRQIAELETDRAVVRSERARAALDEELAELRTRLTAVVYLQNTTIDQASFGSCCAGSPKGHKRWRLTNGILDTLLKQYEIFLSTDAAAGCPDSSWVAL